MEQEVIEYRIYSIITFRNLEAHHVVKIMELEADLNFHTYTQIGKLQINTEFYIIFI